MTLLNAIAKANMLRPNAIDDSLKAEWVLELEGDVAELMDYEPEPDEDGNIPPFPVNPFPKDCDLLMPFPKDNIYHLYVAAMIDFVMEDTQTYINDMTVANTAKDDAFRWWRRHNMKKCKQYIRAFPWQPIIKGEEDETPGTPDEDTTETDTDLPVEGD